MVQNFFKKIYDSLTSSQNVNFIHIVDSRGNEEVFNGHRILKRIEVIQNQLIGIEKDHGILLLVPLKDGLTEAVLACMSLGLCAVVPPKGLGTGKFLRFLKKENSNTILVGRSISRLLKIALIILSRRVISIRDQNADTGKSIQIKEGIDQSLPALVSYSSGSSGMPKRIIRTHRTLNAQHQALEQLFPPWEGQIDFPLFPNVLLHNLSTGVPSVIPDIKDFKIQNIRPEKIYRQLEGKRCESVSGNPFFFKKLMDYCEERNATLPHLKGVVVGGALVSDCLLTRMQKVFNNSEIYILYGATEADPISCLTYDPTAGNTENMYGFNVGVIYNGIHMKFGPGDLIETGSGTQEVGEIIVKGDHVIGDQDEWFRTGDIGYLTPNSRLILTARMGNQGVYNGCQHYSIENILSNHPEIQGAAAIYDRRGFKIYYEGFCSEEGLQKYVEQTLSKKVIQTVQKCRIPMDERHNSKVLYAQLK